MQGKGIFGIREAGLDARALEDGQDLGDDVAAFGVSAKSTVTSRSHPAVATSRASSASAGSSAGTATSDGNMADDSRRAGKPSCPGTTLVRRAPSSGRK